MSVRLSVYLSDGAPNWHMPHKQRRNATSKSFVTRRLRTSNGIDGDGRWANNEPRGRSQRERVLRCRRPIREAYRNECWACHTKSTIRLQISREREGEKQGGRKRVGKSRPSVARMNFRNYLQNAVAYPIKLNNISMPRPLFISHPLPLTPLSPHSFSD